MHYLSLKNSNRAKHKQAEAEVVPSSSLIEIVFKVVVADSDQELDTTYQKLDPQMKSNLTFPVGWVGWWSGWMVGDLESKANLNSSFS